MGKKTALLQTLALSRNVGFIPIKIGMLFCAWAVHFSFFFKLVGNYVIPRSYSTFFPFYCCVCYLNHVAQAVLFLVFSGLKVTSFSGKTKKSHESRVTSHEQRAKGKGQREESQEPRTKTTRQQ